MERDQRSTCRREERNVGGRGGVMGENNLEFWRNLYNSCTCIYISVLHLINVAHTHTHTHTHTHRLVKVPGDAGGMSGLSDAAVGGRGEW